MAIWPVVSLRRSLLQGRDADYMESFVVDHAKWVPRSGFNLAICHLTGARLSINSADLDAITMPLKKRANCVEPSLLMSLLQPVLNDLSRCSEHLVV